MNGYMEMEKLQSRLNFVGIFVVGVSLASVRPRLRLPPEAKKSSRSSHVTDAPLAVSSSRLGPTGSSHGIISLNVVFHILLTDWNLFKSSCIEYKSVQVDCNHHFLHFLHYIWLNF
jgi:hypothetical protein